MKAAVVVANEDVQYLEIPEPEVKPGYVKIKVRYSGICGSDIPRVLHNGVHFYPIVLGHEFSGDVVEIGEGVTSITALSAPESREAMQIMWWFRSRTQFLLTHPFPMSRAQCSSLPQ